MITKNCKTLLKYSYVQSLIKSTNANNITWNNTDKVKEASGTEYVLNKTNYSDFMRLFPMSGSDTVVKISTYADTDPASNSYSGYNGCGVYFGTGTTEPTENDYNIETPLTNYNIIQVNTLPILTNIYTDANDCLCVDLIYSIKNESNESVTITEVGMFSHTQQSGTHRAIMIDHTLLDEPLTMAAGEIKQFKYTIKMDWDI